MTEESAKGLGHRAWFRSTQPYHQDLLSQKRCHFSPKKTVNMEGRRATLGPHQYVCRDFNLRVRFCREQWTRGAVGQRDGHGQSGGQVSAGSGEGQLLQLLLCPHSFPGHTLIRYTPRCNTTESIPANAANCSTTSCSRWGPPPASSADSRLTLQQGLLE